MKQVILSQYSKVFALCPTDRHQPQNRLWLVKLMERDKSVAHSSVSLWKLVISYNSISIAAARVTESRQVSRNIHFRIYYVIHLYMDYWMTFLGDVMPASGYEVVWIIHSIFAFPPLNYCGCPLMWSCFSFFFDVVCAMWFFTRAGSRHGQGWARPNDSLAHPIRIR